MRAPLRLLALAAALALLLVAPAVAEASWGAIAIDPTSGKIGYARHQPSAKRAKTVALAECGESHCKVAVWVANGYGAVVRKKSGVYISGIGDTKAQAFRDARQRAHEKAPAAAWVFSGYS